MNLYRVPTAGGYATVCLCHTATPPVLTLIMRNAGILSWVALP
jgi:hypothetical protein